MYNYIIEVCEYEDTAWLEQNLGGIGATCSGVTDGTELYQPTSGQPIFARRLAVYLENGVSSGSDSGKVFTMSNDIHDRWAIDAAIGPV